MSFSESENLLNKKGLSFYNFEMDIQKFFNHLAEKLVNSRILQRKSKKYYLFGFDLDKETGNPKEYYKFKKIYNLEKILEKVKILKKEKGYKNIYQYNEYTKTWEKTSELFEEIMSFN